MNEILSKNRLPEKNWGKKCDENERWQEVVCKTALRVRGQKRSLKYFSNALVVVSLARMTQIYKPIFF